MISKGNPKIKHKTKLGGKYSPQRLLIEVVIKKMIYNHTYLEGEIKNINW